MQFVYYTTRGRRLAHVLLYWLKKIVKSILLLYGYGAEVFGKFILMNTSCKTSFLKVRYRLDLRGSQGG